MFDTLPMGVQSLAAQHWRSVPVVTMDECIGMSGLSEDELDVVARHEHVPLMVSLLYNGFRRRYPVPRPL